MESIIITGANSGIGYECTLRMAEIAPTHQIVLACRSVESGHKALQEIKQQTNHPNLICLPLDLASLQSIKDFTAAFSQQPYPSIAVLVNNAGIQNVGETKYTEDGFEETFGINQLGSFALTQLLLPLMADDARITFTASGTHDPLQKTGMPAPVYTNAELLAHPKETTEKAMKVGQTRYTTSKLCNIMTVYQLQSHLENTHIHVNAFDPGMVPGTGLARKYPPVLKFISDYVFKALILFMSNVNTAAKSGKRLADLAFSDQYKNTKGKYFEGEKEIKSSADSYNKAFQKDLWDTSLKLTNTHFRLPQVKSS